MIVSELVATIGAKIDRGEFADAALAIEGLGKIAEKVFGLIESGISKAFETLDKVGNKADELGRLAETLGVSAENLQSLGGAASLAADIPFDTFAGGMSKLAIASAKAAAGATEMQDCHHRRSGDPLPPKSPRTRGPPGDFETVLRPSRQCVKCTGPLRSGGWRGRAGSRRSRSVTALGRSGWGQR